MDVGKLPADTLKRLLAGVRPDPSVIIGPAYGEDAAAVRLGGGVLVAAADPVTFATDRIGYYAVSVNANDVAAHGAVPRYFLATVLLPEGTSERDAERVFAQVSESCNRFGVTLVGGHTEVTTAVDRVIVCGCMLGEVAEDELLSTSGARVGDAVILAGGIAVEGTSILAREAGDCLAAKGVPASVIERARGYLDDPGICVLRYSRLAMHSGCVTSLHDPTEGGLATALRELADASGCGIRVDREAVPILPECRRICDAAGVNPLGLIASGSLLITAPGEAAPVLLRAFEEAAVTANRIGTVVSSDLGVRFEDGEALPRFARDEIARYFAERR